MDLNIVGSEMKLNGLVVRPKNSTVDDVHLEELTIRDARVSVADRRVTVADISSTGGKILSWLEPDGTFSLSRLAGTDTATEAPAPPVEPHACATPQTAPTQAAPIKTAPTKTAPAKSDRDWQIALPHVQISGLEVAFEDRGVKPVVPIKLAPIDVKLTGYDSAKAGPLTLEAHIGIDGEGKLSAQGTVDPDTLVSALDLEVKSIDLRTAQPYIARVTDMTLLSGKLGAKGKLGLTRDAADSLQATYAGTLEVTKLRTIDNALEQDFIRWDQLVATGIDYDGAHSHLIIKQIAARRPYARVIIASNGTINITEILRPASAPASGDNTAAAAKTAEPSQAGCPF